MSALLPPAKMSANMFLFGNVVGGGTSLLCLAYLHASRDTVNYYFSAATECGNKANLPPPNRTGVLDVRRNWDRLLLNVHKGIYGAA